MAHISSIGASIYTTLDYAPQSAPGASIVRPTAGTGGTEGTAAAPTGSGWRDAFEVATKADAAASVVGRNTGANTTIKTGIPVSVGDIREFPSFGTPANVVNVPVYGQSTSSQISGQSDAPTQSFTLNYIPETHGALDALRKSATPAIWRIRISAQAGNVPGATSYGDSEDVYDDFYFVGTVASFEITPSLTDSLQATVAVTVSGDFEGPYSDVSATAGTTVAYSTPS